MEAPTGGTIDARPSCCGSSTSPSTRWPTPARRSTRSTSTRCPTATPAPTCTSPSPPPATRSARPPAGDADADRRVGARGVQPGRAARRPRQLRRDPQQMLGAICRRIAAAAARTSATPRSMAEALREATDASYAAVGTPGRGHHAHRRPGRLRRRRRGAPRTRAPALATCSPPPRPPPARPWPAPPSSSQVLRDAGVVDAGGRGLSVILDAAETVLTGRRPAPVTAAVRRARDPGPAARAGRGDLHRGRARRTR